MLIYFFAFVLAILVFLTMASSLAAFSGKRRW
jgi:hypothetical protein